MVEEIPKLIAKGMMAILDAEIEEKKGITLPTIGIIMEINEKFGYYLDMAWESGFTDGMAAQKDEYEKEKRNEQLGYLAAKR